MQRVRPYNQLLHKISTQSSIGRIISRVFSNSLINRKEDSENTVGKDRKEAQEKMYNIKKELSEFLNAKLDNTKKKEKQQERISALNKLGNVMIILGFIVGLVIYVVSLI